MALWSSMPVNMSSKSVLLCCFFLLLLLTRNPSRPYFSTFAIGIVYWLFHAVCINVGSSKLFLPILCFFFPTMSNLCKLYS
uniref:Putative secreted protein n=1 Tax=Ixodes ricinus TaxID=34613 RepID=A0A6B0TY82_IXORI